MEENIQVWCLCEGMKVRLNKDKRDNRAPREAILEYYDSDKNMWKTKCGWFISSCVVEKILYNPSEDEPILTSGQTISIDIPDSSNAEPREFNGKVSADMITIPNSEYKLLKRVFDKFVGG